MNSSVLNLISILFGVFVLLVVFYQNYYLSKTDKSHNQLNFFSYFTEITNILVAISFIFYGLNIFSPKILGLFFYVSVQYSVITFLVFNTLLKAKNAKLIPWINLLLHYIVPLSAITFWFFSQILRPTFIESLLSLFFALIYLTYTLIRGRFTDWYPYYFLNPNQVGYLGVCKYCLGLLLFTIALNYLLLKV